MVQYAHAVGSSSQEIRNNWVWLVQGVYRSITYCSESKTSLTLSGTDRLRATADDSVSLAINKRNRYVFGMARCRKLSLVLLNRS